jgi:ankyrin repeat protein
MSKQKMFSKYIQDNKYNDFIEIKSESTALRNKLIREASQFGRLDMVSFLLNFSDSDPTSHKNSAIGVAAENGHIEIVKLLLKDTRINPAASGNLAISSAYMYHHKSIFSLLWLEGRVKKSLKKDNPDLYKKILIKER